MQLTDTAMPLFVKILQCFNATRPFTADDPKDELWAQKCEL